ncbi:Vacuolar membrane protease [Dissophora ornata]|nr:Vacuolar membrane protease [Dissophora ornata]
MSLRQNNMFNHLIQSDSKGSGLSGMDDDDFEDASDAGSNNSNKNSNSNSGQMYPWSNYSISQMRDLLRQRGQLSTGNRSALKKRLKNSERTPTSGGLANATNTNMTSFLTTGTAVNNAAATSQATVTEGITKTITTLEASVVETDPKEEPVRSAFGEGVIHSALEEIEHSRPRLTTNSIRSRFPKRTNSFSAHFSEFINRRRDALETERQEISVYTSPMTVLSYFVLYILHEFRVALLWIISQQYLLVVLPVIAAIVYFVYQMDGAHQPLLKHAESGLIWYGYWTLLGIASSVGLGTGLHTFILFLGPHIAEVTLAAYNCGNTDFDVRGDHRLTLIPSAALSGNRNEELAAIEDLLKRKPDSVSYKERILIMVHEGMKRLGFFGIFLCASIPNPLFDLAGITCGHFLIPFSTFFGATFLGKAVVKSSIQTLFVILMFSADTLASFMGWLEHSVPFIHGYLADGINSQKGVLHGDGKASEDQLENSTSLVGLIWNTVIFIMISYFLLSIVETMALAQIKRRHDKELVELEGKIRSGDTKAIFTAVSEELVESSKKSASQELHRTTTVFASLLKEDAQST